MSEFKCSCPACGQSISCDTSLTGTEMVCPVCHADIVVPQDPAEPAGVPPPTDAPPPWTGHNASTAAPRTSRLAIASLVCSLSSLVTCIGWLPGIICGHLARSRMRRDSLLQGTGLATAGLVIGYLVLTLEVGTAGVHLWRLSVAMKQGYENVRNDLATNNVMVVQTLPATVSNSPPDTNDDQPTEPIQPVAVATNEPLMKPAAPGWTSDISHVSFPNHPASGKLHGNDFALKTAMLRGTDLRMNSANGLTLDILGLGTPIAGSSYEILPTDAGGGNPRVKMTWNDGVAVQTVTLKQGYGLKLQFDKVANRKISGRLYLCFPDDSKSCIAGTFEVRPPRSR